MRRRRQLSLVHLGGHSLVLSRRRSVPCAREADDGSALPAMFYRSRYVRASWVIHPATPAEETHGLSRNTGEAGTRARPTTNGHVVGVEHDGDAWEAYVPDPHGCVAAGTTREAVESRIREAARGPFAAPPRDGLCVLG